MEKYNLFLDDVRDPKDAFQYTYRQIYVDLDWEVVRNYTEFIKIIEEKGLPEIVSFDHDLAAEHYHENMYNGEQYDELYNQFIEKTGLDCAKWLINYCMGNKLSIPKTIYVHSMNPVGGKNIESIFISYLKSLHL